MNPIQAILVPIDLNEPCTFVELTKYEDIQGHVEGLFDPVHAVMLNQDFKEEDITVYCNDEGLVWGLDENTRATAIVGRRIVGPVLITGWVDAEANTLTVNPDFLPVINWIGERYLEWRAEQHANAQEDSDDTR